jgi:hypothetical protein
LQDRSHNLYRLDLTVFTITGFPAPFLIISQKIPESPGTKGSDGGTDRQRTFICGY